jgi:hypothetical protein
MLARSGDHLHLPFKFMEAIEGKDLACSIMQECSGGQPPYDAEVYYDNKGKCYLLMR